MIVSEPQLTALREAAVDGLSCDGLRVTVDEGAYTFTTPGERHTDVDDVTAVAQSTAEYVTNWYYWTHRTHTEEGTAYLRWLERADEYDVPQRYDALYDGVERTWGELHITTRLDEDGPGERRYSLCNEHDRDREDLDEYDDPLDARQLAKYDDDGNYRPLKTAPTLQTGWQFTDLPANDALQAIDFFYPATVQNWYLERQGALDVSHWQETAQRQTGIYDIVDDLDPTAIDWLASACCVDSQCLKRRQWDETEEAPLDVPRGDGEFPCREPCSLVIAAARKLTLLERESTHEYTFELTPSEKEQLEDLIDAVSEGRVGAIREADMNDGANRYRTRFLRAKRFDEDGRLCGVPTDPDDSA